MRTLGLVFLLLTLIEGIGPTQSAEPPVSLKLADPQPITAPAESIVQAKAIDLLKTSNFNSKDHPGPIFPDGVLGVQRRYRAAIAGQYLAVAFPEPRQFQLIRGQVKIVEIVVGLNNPQYADSLFTVDPEGRVVEHAKFSGTAATELMELIVKTQREHKE
jgi:hypothetical protein